jgi:SAM-dependent methyltransferase
MADLEEPLLESAPLAWKLAQRVCHTDSATGESCAWNHGLWQILRIMGLAGTAARRAEFYQRAIRASVAETDAPRILISGATDYALLAQVMGAVHGRNARPAITVVDLCETPLHLNRWYADRYSCRIATVRSDLFSYAPVDACDLVCTDSFLGRFPYELWPVLVDKWRALLRPGGTLLTASRLRSGAAPERVVFGAAQARAFQETVWRLAAEWRESLGIEPEEIAHYAGLYAARHFTYPVRSRNQLQMLFEEGGFALHELSTTVRNAGNSEGINGPSVPAAGGEFLTVIATRV